MLPLAHVVHTAFTLPAAALAELQRQHYTVVRNFVPPAVVSTLVKDVALLRAQVCRVSQVKNIDARGAAVYCCMPYTCSAHAVRMRCACSVHAVRMPRTCSTASSLCTCTGSTRRTASPSPRWARTASVGSKARSRTAFDGASSATFTQRQPLRSSLGTPLGRKHNRHIGQRAQAADSLAEAVAAPHLDATPGPFWRWLSLLGAIVPTPKTLVDPGAIIGASLYTAPCRHGDPAARRQLIETLDGVRERLSVLRLDAGLKPLTPSRTEGLYVYYPNGGFYRRHVDAAPKGLGYSSEARAFSYLLYLNEGWREEDGGCLRLFTGGSGGSGGSGGREEATLLVRRARSFLQVRRAGIRYLMDTSCKKSPRHDAASFVDVEPRAGTLVVFSSDEIEHEVLDTFAPRLVLAGWWHSDSRGARFRRVLSRVLILVGLRR